MNKKELEQLRTRLGRLVKERREEFFLTQDALAERSGVSRITISRIENSGSWPGLKEFVLVCEALDLFPPLTHIDPKDEKIPKAVKGKRGRFKNIRKRVC